MELTDSEAQRVLNKAVLYEGELYGLKGQSIYEFRRTIGCIYHGFNITESIEEELKRKILGICR